MMLTAEEIYHRWYNPGDRNPAHLTPDEADHVAACMFLPITEEMDDDRTALRTRLNSWREQADAGTATLFGRQVIVDA